MGDDPPYLAVGTDVSAKYKGAFCEAKIRKIVRVVKCKVTFKSGFGGATLSDDHIKGTLRVGANVEAKHPDKNQFLEATINRIQDCSQYTVVFDDGDITTLRRSALCLKSGRHFNESETLDQLPLTHPEHFSNPVVGGRRGARRRIAKNDADKDESSDEEDTPSQKGKRKYETHIDLGTVVCVESDKKKGKDNWFPGLVVSPSAQTQKTSDKMRKDECLVRSFKDGRYYTVPKKEITEFVKDQHNKQDAGSQTLKTAVEKAMAFLERDELPPHWDRHVLFGNQDDDDDDADNDSEVEGYEEKQRETNDNFVAQLYRFMEERGTPIGKSPVICNKDLDLYKLHKIVTDQGGYLKITNGGQWKNVTIKIGLGAMPSTSTVNLVKQAYKKYLLDYEQIDKKIGVSDTHIYTSASKPRNSRSQYRGFSNVIPAASKEFMKKEELEAAKKIAEEKEATKANTTSIVEPEGDTASVDSNDTKKSEASSATAEEPRRSRSRQESRNTKKDSLTPAVEEEKAVVADAKKKPKKSTAKEKEKEKEKESDSSSSKAEPPSPAPSSQGSKKGRGASRKKKEKEEETPEKEVVQEEVASSSESISKDIKIQLGDKLSVLYPKGGDKQTYEAKVVDINEKAGTYLVHYTGWNNRYDEWISRDRILENLSLRTNYQGKSQGKGPALQPSVASASKDKEKEKSKEADDKSDSSQSQMKSKVGAKKKGRTTPAPTPSPVVSTAPTSSTGTRSKSGTIKRKRMSAEFEEPTKKKRKSMKKAEKDASNSEESDASADSEQKIEQPPQSAVPVTPVAAPVSPTRATKAAAAASKEKKENEETSESTPITTSPKDEKASSTDVSSEKEKQNQVIDLNQIRSEMKGLQSIVKSKSTSSIPSTPSVSVSPSQPASSSSSVSANSGQKLDIYDFEDEVTDTPKLKMFSPRSPDKKEDTAVASKAVSESSVSVGKPAPLTDTPKTKEISPPSAPPVTSSPSTKSEPPQPIQSHVVIIPITATATSSSTASNPSVPKSTAPVIVIKSTNISSFTPAIPLSTGPIRVAITIPSPAHVSGHPAPRGMNPLIDAKVRMDRLPISTQQQRLRLPTSAPPPLVPSSTALVRAATPPLIQQGVGPSAGLPLVTTSPAGVGHIPKPLPQMQMRPVPKPATFTTGAMGPGQSSLPPHPTAGDFTGPKDAKVLPFPVRSHEIFPNLLQQDKGAAAGGSTIGHYAQDLGPVKTPVYSGIASIGKPEKYSASAGSSAVLNIPTVKPVAKVMEPSPAPGKPQQGTPQKKEKRKRVSAKEKASAATQSEFKSAKDPSASPPAKKRPAVSKADNSKGLSSTQLPMTKIPPLPPLTPLPTGGLKKDKKAPNSEALSKINDTISSLMQKTEDQQALSSPAPPVTGKPGVSGKPEHVPQAPLEKSVKSRQGESPVTKVIERRTSPIKTNFLKDPVPAQQPEKILHQTSEPPPSKLSVIMPPRPKSEPRVNLGSKAKVEEKPALQLLKEVTTIPAQSQSPIIISTVAAPVGSKVNKDIPSIPQSPLPPEPSRIIVSSEAVTTAHQTSVTKPNIDVIVKAPPPTTPSSDTVVKSSAPHQPEPSKPAEKPIVEETIHEAVPAAIPEVLTPTTYKTEKKEVIKSKDTLKSKSVVVKVVESHIAQTVTVVLPTPTPAPPTNFSGIQELKAETGKQEQVTIMEKAPEKSKISISISSSSSSSSRLDDKEKVKEDEKLRPLTPSFLTASEELGPDFEDEPILPREKLVAERSADGGRKAVETDELKEDESCSSLLCEEEIPGSPAVDDDNRSKFDFRDESSMDKDEKSNKKDLQSSRVEKPSSGDDIIRGKSTKEKDSKDDKTKAGKKDDPIAAMDKDFTTGDNSSPSTPESTTLSTETGGSLNADGDGRISPSGEGASSKSKESTDGESQSGDGSKTYFSEGDLATARKSEKLFEPPPSPPSKRGRDSRGRNISPPPKRRRVSRRKSPEEVSRPFNYRGRTSSGRKIQSGIEAPESVKAPLPPIPINIQEPPYSAKFNHMLPKLDGVTDPDERIALVAQFIASVKEKYVEIKTKEQARQRRVKRRKRKERERAAAERQALKAQELKMSSQ